MSYLLLWLILLEYDQYRVIWVFLEENCSILGYSQQVQVISCRHFRTIYRSHLLRIQESWSLKTGSICCPETSVRNSHYSSCNNPEEGSSLYFAAEAQELGRFFSFSFVISTSNALAQASTGKTYTISPLSANPNCAFTFQFTFHILSFTMWTTSMYNETMNANVK